MKMVYALALVAGLSACAPKTLTMDSARTVVGADATYIAASAFGQQLVMTGTLSQGRYRSLDAQAYTALLAVRAAQKAAVAADVTTAELQFSAAIAAIYAATTGEA